MQQTDDTPTDAYGDEMVFVDSYGGHLPRSANIPTARTQHGVSGVTHDGEIYCVDCAIEMGLIDRDDLDKHSADLGPWTGLVLPSYETDTLYHCGRHKQCVNSVSGENHPYNHEHDIGIGIEERAIQH
jgi:hypothetical protein